MLGYYRNDMSEEIDVNKTSEQCACIICNYYYFLKVDSRFSQKVCNGCYALKKKPKSFNNVATVSVKESYYRTNFWLMNKGEAITIMKNSDLKKQCGSLKNT